MRPTAARSRATAGETRTVAYLAAEFAKLGLAPGSGGSLEQKVPIVETTFGGDASLTLGGRTLRYPDDAVVGTRRIAPESRVVDSPIVFAGCGIVEPEHGWNDYAGLDVRARRSSC